MYVLAQYNKGGNDVPVWMECVFIYVFIYVYMYIRTL